MGRQAIERLAVQGLDRTIIIDVRVVDPIELEVQAQRQQSGKAVRMACRVALSCPPGTPDQIVFGERFHGAKLALSALDGKA